MIRAKFFCQKKVEFKEPSTGGVVNFLPVYSEDPTHENKTLWQATPAGSICMTITNPRALGFFEEGKEYYVDFSKCHEQPQS